jgi:hypothetical protein
MGEVIFKRRAMDQGYTEELLKAKRSVRAASTSLWKEDLTSIEPLQNIQIHYPCLVTVT